MGDRNDSFRERLTACDQLVGTFVKTPSPIVCEVLAYSSLHVACLDAEHAPFGRMEMDQCIAAFVAADFPCLVRVGSDSATDIRNALDCGATGIVVPHVTTAEQAARIVKRAHFGEGGRGYAGSPRAAGYGTASRADYIAQSRRTTTVIVQIEDLAALPNVEAIASVEGVDALFIGRADLSVAMDKPASDPAVIDTVRTVLEQGRAAGTAVGMFTPALSELPDWRARGASLFLLSSDHSMILAGANELARS
ncbi:MAG: aldolase/citrate lyase family protein [Pseudomonadota bacterium]